MEVYWMPINLVLVAESHSTHNKNFTKPHYTEHPQFSTLRHSYVASRETNQIMISHQNTSAGTYVPIPIALRGPYGPIKKAKVYVKEEMLPLIKQQDPLAMRA